MKNSTALKTPNAPQIPIQNLPIQVKGITPGRFSPDVWKSNSLKEAMEYSKTPLHKMTVSGRQWILQFKDLSTLAGEFLA